jgi:hypothetical protein
MITGDSTVSYDRSTCGLQTETDKQSRDYRENTFKSYPIWEWTVDEYERKPVSTKRVIAIVASIGGGL